MESILGGVLPMFFSLSMTAQYVYKNRKRGDVCIFVLIDLSTCFCSYLSDKWNPY